jgi:hypothetical protein
VPVEEAYQFGANPDGAPIAVPGLPEHDDAGITDRAGERADARILPTAGQIQTYGDEGVWGRVPRGTGLRSIGRKAPKRVDESEECQNHHGIVKAK